MNQTESSEFDNLYSMKCDFEAPLEKQLKNLNLFCRLYQINPMNLTISGNEISVNKEGCERDVDVLIDVLEILVDIAKTIENN